MIEKMRESVVKIGAFVALLTDLSKAFECLPHELLILKLHSYRFDLKLLNLICGYLSNRKLRVKVGGTYISRQEILYYCILGPGKYCTVFSGHCCSIAFFVIYSTFSKTQIQQAHCIIW